MTERRGAGATRASLTRFLGVSIALGLIVLALPSSASAQATRTWVSGVGDDANPCSRTAPCKTFAGAISKTATGGEINCLDPGGFGAVTITKAIKIKCDYSEGGVLAAGTNGVTVNATVNDRVILRGLDIVGAGSGLSGIRVLQARRVKVYDTEISGFTQDGFSFIPANAAKALLKDVTIEDNGRNGVLAAAPTGGSGIRSRVTIQTSELSDNRCGVVSTSHTLTGSPTVDCATSAVATANGARVGLFNSTIIDHDVVPGPNGSAAVFSRGVDSLIQIGGNTVTGNNFGLRALDFGANGIFSFGDNYVVGNTNNGTPNGTITPTRK